MEEPESRPQAAQWEHGARMSALHLAVWLAFSTVNALQLDGRGGVSGALGIVTVVGGAILSAYHAVKLVQNVRAGRWAWRYEKSA